MSKTPQKVRFRIDAEGNIEYDIQGIKGSGCEELAKRFEELGKQEHGKKTAEYYEKEVEEKLRTRRR